jgi:pimeloyl-ACP methyl ester carboxylesterase
MRLDDALAALPVPTLFVWGAHDQLAPADVARVLVRRMSDAKLTPIHDAGHIAHIDQPDPVVTAISGFLRQPASQQQGTVRRTVPGTRSSRLQVR